MREQFESKYKKNEPKVDQDTKKYLQQQARKKEDDFDTTPFTIASKTRNNSPGQ
jgi:hypothetical protein